MWLDQNPQNVVDSQVSDIQIFNGSTFVGSFSFSAIVESDIENYICQASANGQYVQSSKTSQSLGKRVRIWLPHAVPFSTTC